MLIPPAIVSNPPMITSENHFLQSPSLPDRVLYSRERFFDIVKEAIKENSIFTLKDRIGFVYDAFALGKAGLSNLSAAMSMAEEWKNEAKCE
jgi:hypothetical protein